MRAGLAPDTSLVIGRPGWRQRDRSAHTDARAAARASLSADGYETPLHAPDQSISVIMT